MTATNDWTFDGQLESPDTIPATADQERAKIATLFGKGSVGTAQSDNIDYQAAFEEHKKAEQAQQTYHRKRKQSHCPAQKTILQALINLTWHRL